MPLAIRIRACRNQLVSNSFTFCTCAPRCRPDFPTPVPSTLAKPPRICTSHSYLNFNSFNTCAPAPPISFDFCTYKTPRGSPHAAMSQKQTTSIPSSFSSPRASANSASLRCPCNLLCSQLAAEPSSMPILNHQSPVTNHESPITSRRIFIFNHLRTQFLPSPAFSGVCTLPGEGVPPVSNQLSFIGLRNPPFDNPSVLNRLSNFSRRGVGSYRLLRPVPLALTAVPPRFSVRPSAFHPHRRYNPRMRSTPFPAMARTTLLAPAPGHST